MKIAKNDLKLMIAYCLYQATSSDINVLEKTTQEETNSILEDYNKCIVKDVKYSQRSSIQYI